MIFNTAYETVYEKADTPVGDQYKPVMKERTADDGTKYLEQVDEVDLHEFINACADDHRISNIIKRYDPDTFGLKVTDNPTVTDLRGAPTSLMEAYQMIEKQKEVFNKLNNETKEKYGKSFEQYLADIATEEVKPIKEKMEVKENAAVDKQ